MKQSFQILTYLKCWSINSWIVAKTFKKWVGGKGMVCGEIEKENMENIYKQNKTV